tara:strand:+ start:4964 stop:5341 length:378 start_codon:yes stop_codon:yes gene_type:complete
MKKVILVLLLLVLVGCQSVPEGDILIDSDGSLSEAECSIRGLEGKYVMIGSAFCSHCVDTKPVFEADCEETGVDCVSIDTSTTEGWELLESYDLSVLYTPTFVFDCEYFIGAREDYVGLMQGEES